MYEWKPEQEATRPVLLDRYPHLEGTIAWTPLGVQRTPIERVELTLDRGSTQSILVKRDDLTARPYGGNKVRKLEFILAEAMRRGATRVITAGAVGSHHALATTVYARALGIDVTLVLFPQSRTEHVRQVLLLDHALGAELRFTPRMESLPVALIRARLAHRRQRPYLIAPGGSDPIGTLGYVSAGLELADQVAGLDAPVGAIHVAAGTMGTAAGLALGLALANVTIPIAATRITSRLVANELTLRRLLRRTGALLARAGLEDPPVERATGMIELRHDQIGQGYGKATEAAREAMRVFAAIGLTLDATYTAKAAAELIASPPQAGLPLFLHTLSAVEPVANARGVTFADLPEPFRRYLEH